MIEQVLSSLNRGTLSLIVAAVLLGGCASTQPASAPQDTPQAQAATATTTVAAQPDSQRVMPYPVTPPPSYQTAVKNGTRTKGGAPGPDYWQQFSTYRLKAKLDTENRRLEGQGTIVYHNSSPDTLNELFMELALNHHLEGTIRNESAEVTGGMEIEQLAVNGTQLRDLDNTESDNGQGQDEQPGYYIDASRMMIFPDEPLAPGDSTTLEVQWGFDVPSQGASGRMGYDDDNLFFMGYWYPRMSVYDDVNGWYTDPFLGRAEFYDGYGNYDLQLTVPAQWVVNSTGTLQNRAEVLAPAVLERLQQAEQSDEVIHVVTKDDFGKATRKGKDGWLTWHFTAHNVRDVAFSATSESMWDAVRTAVGDRDGDGQTDYIRADALYRDLAPLWVDAAKYVQQSINFLSRYTAFPYPWPHMTSVEGSGIIGGGMEYPMMTVIGPYNDANTEALYYVTAHELAHMWVPMIVGTNERRYSWMDEGTTTFNENQARMEKYPGSHAIQHEQRSYMTIAGSEMEGPMMRWSDYQYNGYAFGIASYSKPASVLVALRGVLGKQTFNKAYHEYIKRWAYKHPYPWDMFRTFEDVSGRDLGWFWRSWYYETWTLDQAVQSVEPTDGGTRIVIADKGKIPMPVNLTITMDNGKVMHRTISVDTWLEGHTHASLMLNEPGNVQRVEIDAEMQFPDINRNNNLWKKPASSQSR